MRFMRARLLALAGVATLATTLCAACTGSVSASNNGAPILNLAHTGDAVQRVFNPYLPINAYSVGSKFEIYEPLVQVSKISAESYKPWLAESWSWSSDSKTLTLQLRKGVKWTDGQAFTSADVVFSYNLVKKFPALNLNGIEFSSIQAQGDNTVVMTFDKNARPNFDTIVQLEIVPEHVWSKVSDPTTYQDPSPVGTGPFTLDAKSFTPQGYTLLKNAKYWQAGKPAIGGLRFVTYKDNTAVAAALVQGDVDWSSAYIANIDQTFTAKGKQFQHFWPVIGADGLITNDAAAPFNDLQVRKAVSDGINRSQVAASANRPPATNPIGLPLPLFNDSIAPQYKDSKYTYDVNAAKQILQADGYTMGADGYFAKGGKQLAFSITIPSAYTEQVGAAQVIQANLKQAGIKVTVNGVSVDAINALTQKGNYQATIGYPIAEFQTAYGLYDAWMNPKYSVPIGQPIVTDENIERWEDPQTSQYFADYIAATTDDQRKAAIAGLEGRFVDGIPWIVLSYYQGYGDWNSTKVTGFPTDSNPYWTAEPNEVVALNLKPTGK
ncbi:ABC transporter substrate-binding protein [Rugosimonospora africana]|uniref:Peptide ABC transporter substrate-binding protein n=1 Tax=Rugosimonospora africana TaxID=556532 RepID=A0A8J3QSF7_9ACTN|nr:ABC transporter substrate-binding protein [Rugosimonospora africana]GIH15934.1 peptide ABC transporter substrate-binding protein [Rugosimonospora africana]